MLKVIRKLLLKFIDDIDAGNSVITDEEGKNLILMLSNITEPRLSKYQACQLLNISRSSFDNLVREGKLPKGIKQSGFKELFWKKSDLMKYITNGK